jgi:hypothetical protein
VTARLDLRERVNAVAGTDRCSVVGWMALPKREVAGSDVGFDGCETVRQGGGDRMATVEEQDRLHIQGQRRGRELPALTFSVARPGWERARTMSVVPQGNLFEICHWRGISGEVQSQVKLETIPCSPGVAS